MNIMVISHTVVEVIPQNFNESLLKINEYFYILTKQRNSYFKVIYLHLILNVDKELFFITCERPLSLLYKQL